MIIIYLLSHGRQARDKLTMSSHSFPRSCVEVCPVRIFFHLIRSLSFSICIWFSLFPSSHWLQNWHSLTSAPDAFPPTGFTPMSSCSPVDSQRRRKKIRLDISSPDVLRLMHDFSHPNSSPRPRRSGSQHQIHGHTYTSNGKGTFSYPDFSAPKQKQRFGIFCTGKAGHGFSGGRTRVISMAPGRLNPQSYRRV